MGASSTSRHLCPATECPQVWAGLHISPTLPPQVTVQYRQDNLRGHPYACPYHRHLRVQHNEDITLEDMRRALKEQVIRAVVPAQYLDEDTIYHLQPSGRLVIGGPQVHPCLQMSPDFAYVPSDVNLQEVGFV